MIFKKKLFEYDWFKRYSHSQIGIRVFGRNFYATRKRCLSCKNCQFQYFDNQYTSNEIPKCELNIDIDIKTGRPKNICFPCKTRVLNFETDFRDGLYKEIIRLCKDEDEFDIDGIY